MSTHNIGYYEKKQNYLLIIIKYAPISIVSELGLLCLTLIWVCFVCTIKTLFPTVFDTRIETNTSFCYNIIASSKYMKK